MYAVWSYFAYLAISLGVTIRVARTLQKNGRIFLVDAFHGNSELADSVNHPLVVGFYLVNIGFFTVVFRTYAITNPRDLIDLPIFKIGMAVLTIGSMALVNLSLLSRMRKRGQVALAPPPFRPEAIFSVPARP